MLLTKEFSIPYGHRLPLHEGACRNPHGHNAKISVTLEGDICQDKASSSDGMLLDFKDLKALVREEIDKFDHAYICDSVLDAELLKIFKDRGFKVVELLVAPTAENLSQYLFEVLQNKVDMLGLGIDVKEVEWHETDTSYATATKVSAITFQK